MIKLVTGKDGFQFAVLDQDTHIGKWCQEQGELVHDKGVALHILPHIKPGDVVIDVGANIGDHTYAYGKAVGPTGTVIAYEPNTHAFTCLSVNCREMPWVTPIFAGLGARTSLMSFSPDHENIGRSHFNDAVGATPVYALDDINLDRLNLIKLDIEGMEPAAIEGAAQTIVKCRPIIICEVNHDALARFDSTPDGLMKQITRLGYRVEMLDKNTNANMPQFDIICFPQ